MQPNAPNRASTVLMDQAEAARSRRRRVKPRLPMLVRATVILGAVAVMSACVTWFVQETSHTGASEALRKSPVFEARSLKPPLETKSVPLAPYAVNKKSPAPPATLSTDPWAPPAAMPPWLVADSVTSTDLLRRELRDRGAMQVGQTMRLGMLKVAELLALDKKAWLAGKATAVANENDTSALLLTFYLHHLDGRGDAEGVNAMRKAIESGMPQEQAVRKWILAGRTPAELENRMKLAFANLGIELQFTRRGGAVFGP